MKILAQTFVGLFALQAVIVSTVGGDEFETFIVQQVRGKSAEIKPGGTSVWQPAKERETHKAGSMGRTGDQSTFTVAFDTRNRFRLLPNTEVIIQTSTHDPRFRKVIDLTMNKGTVEVDLDALPQGYQMKIQTPTAVCGAIGTRFKVKAENQVENYFECTQGTIFARSAEDGSFNAPEIHQGQSLKAKVAPGKENSYAHLQIEGGAMTVALGSSANKLEVGEGTSFQLAQQHTRSTKQLALKVEQGSVGGKKDGHYVVDGGEILDANKAPKGAALVDAYLAAAQKEGTLKAQLDQARGGPDEEKIAKDLEEAAGEATQKSSALFDYRRVIRETVRENLRNTQGNFGRPTQIPSPVPR